MGLPLNFTNSFGETWEYSLLDHLIMDFPSEIY